MAEFVDKVVLHVAGGNGGHGCASVHREKFKPLGGPDGGNGGRGGSVILEVDPSTTTLLDYHFSPHRKATSGKPGQGGNRFGADGDDVVLKVPAGTIVREWVDGGPGEDLADLTDPGMQLVIAPGGRGGLGNAALASARRKAPGFALKGEPGSSCDILLELKSVADIALVGYPSAGKSSLIAVMSAARPKIADYPFTTLVPNLGVVEVGSMRFTVADVPGLIPGASSGRGLGLEFLRHVERCVAIVHVLDCGTLESDRNPIDDLDALLAELAAYPVTTDSHPEPRPLTSRRQIVALNKVDDPDSEAMAEMVRPVLVERGFDVYDVSAITRAGLQELKYAMSEVVRAERAATPKQEAKRIVVRPKAVDDVGFTVTKETCDDHPSGVQFRILGERPVRWVIQTDFGNDEAVGYLADRLNRLGVETELYKAGAVAGSQVLIGQGDQAVIFDWEPTMRAGAEHLSGPRGSDVRLEESQRPTRAVKREAFATKMDDKTAAREELAAERRAGLWSAADTDRPATVAEGDSADVAADDVETD